MTRRTAPKRRPSGPVLAAVAALSAVLASPVAARTLVFVPPEAPSVPGQPAQGAEADDILVLLPEPLAPLAQWPCLDAPGCDGAARAAVAPGDEAPEATAIPVPAALGLLGFAMALLALVLHRGRPTA